MGSPAFAVPPFQALVAAGYHIPLVISQPDKPKGRKGVLTPTAVKEAALSCNIPVITPQNVNDAEVLAQIKALQPDLLVVTAFGQILKKPLLTIAPAGAVNIHASLLPLYRGAAPIHQAIMDGQTRTGITTMFMDAGLDTGDMILQEGLEILPEDNTGTVQEKLAAIGAQLILETVALIQDGIAPRQPQDHEKSTYAKKILREQEQIDWQQPMLTIHNQIRALAPEIGAYAYYQEKGVRKVMKFWHSALTTETTTSPPGTIIGFDKQSIFVACGDGKVLQILALQPAGKGKMRAIDWWRGQQKNYQEESFLFTR